MNLLRKLFGHKREVGNEGYYVIRSFVIYMNMGWPCSLVMGRHVQNFFWEGGNLRDLDIDRVTRCPCFSGTVPGFRFMSREKICPRFFVNSTEHPWFL
jgi:hypothetical protein